MPDPRSISPNNGRAPATLVGCLALACEVLEGIMNDHPGALCIAQIRDARNLAMDALSANEQVDAAMDKFDAARPTPDTLCVAWVTMNGIEPTGQYRGRYRQEPIYRPAPLVHACIWANEASEEDRVKGKAYADSHGYCLFAIPAAEQDPLTLARERALALYRMGEVQAI